MKGGFVDRVPNRLNGPSAVRKTHLVTGGAGFIGSYLTEALLKRGQRVIAVDNESTGDWSNLSEVADHRQLTQVTGSVTDAGLMRELIWQADVIYHLAAAVGVQLIANAPIETIETNIYPTELLFSELLQRWKGGAKVKCFLASSSEVYGKNPKETWHEEDDLVFGPTHLARWSYGASKAIDEFLALAYWRQYQLPVVVGRFFNVVGPRQTGRYGMVLPRFVQAALEGGPLIVHDDGQQQRCFAHVHDVVTGVLNLIDTDAALGKVFNIGSDQPVTILELARRVAAAVAPSPEIVFQSYADAYSEDFEDVRRRVPCLDRVRQTIDFRIGYSLEQIIEEVVQWQQARRAAEDGG
ncbi:MAG: NAD-dependent epimerase/dehydratase family protein [Planctomycetales bacterium]|nr:NAD-dependent epimerase/dehydratase family protein [Planctomycetales bacterium]